MELENVRPEEITFQEKLFDSETSYLFLVTVREHICVMKVHHGRGPPKYHEDREMDVHVIESSAYRRLREHGLCERGMIPNFLGTMRKFDPSPCQPHLRRFLEDKYPPSAIFLEFIPGLETIRLHNCTEKRMDNFLSTIQEIHKAHILHNDPFPRNMKVVKDDPERVVWLDFDRAEIYDENQLDEWETKLLEEERAIVADFHRFLLADCAKGKLDQALMNYRF